MPIADLLGSINNPPVNVEFVSGDGPLNCSFCGKSQYDVRKLVAGPSVFICDTCIEKFAYVRDDEDPTKAREIPGAGETDAPKLGETLQYCNFCGKSLSEVINVFEGPSVSICNECIGHCVDILSEDILSE